MRGAASGVPHRRTRDGATPRPAGARAERGAEPAPRPVPLPLRERGLGAGRRGARALRAGAGPARPGRPPPPAPRRPEAAGHRPRPCRRDHRRGVPAASQLSLARARGPGRAARRRRRDASCRGSAARADPRRLRRPPGRVPRRPSVGRDHGRLPDRLDRVPRRRRRGGAAKRARSGGRRRAAAGVGLDPEARRAGGLERGLPRARAPHLAGAAAARCPRGLPWQLGGLDVLRVGGPRDSAT